MSTVFYSWQSDLPGKSNRNLIESALKRAIGQLNKIPELVPSPSDRIELVKDTRGEAGSPDIVYAILSKIDKADVCVFDVSIIARVEGRAFPNPNVLVELGYALNVLGDKRIVMVFNSATGNPRHDLPFDLGFKRAMQFEARESDDDLAERRKGLAVDLEHALREIYDHLRKNRFSITELTFFGRLYSNLRSFLDAAAEFPTRISTGSEFQQDCRFLAEGLRELSAEDVARNDPSVLASLNELAGALDSIAQYRMVLPNGRELLRMTEAATKRAVPLLRRCLPPVKQQIGEHDYSSEKRKLAQRAIDELARLDTGLRERASGLSQIRGSLSRIGSDLLGLCSQLEAIDDPDSEMLRRIAHALHESEVRGSSVTGFRPEEELRDKLSPLIDELGSFAGDHD